MNPPVYIKGHLSFSVEGKNFDYRHQNISVYGIPGLPWTHLSSQEHFGKYIDAQIEALAPTPAHFSTRAHIMREFTLHAEYMGLRLSLEREQRGKLSEIISKHGFYPTDYIRKYPRLPSTQLIQTFPQRALVNVEPSQHLPIAPPPYPLVFDVVNLSPNGVLLSTENQLALSIIPSQRLEVVFQPRGWFPIQIRVHGLVCRVADELGMNPPFNLTRYLGIKFTRVDPADRSAFVDLLKDILERIRDQAK